MGAYLGFLGIIFIQWLAYFPLGRAQFMGERDERRKKHFVIITCVEMILLAGLRATNIGADTTTYLNALKYYESIDHSEILRTPLVWPFDFEIGYLMLTKICAWLNMSETVFLFLIAAVVYIPLFRFIFEYSANPAISVYVYFAFSLFAYSLGLFRQLIAISITMLALRYIIDRKFIKYAAMIVLAMTFHFTAIIAFPFYWISRVRFKNRMLFILGGEMILFVVARPIIVSIARALPQYAHYLGGKYDTQGGTYIMLTVLNVILIAGYIVIQETGRAGKADELLNLSFNAVAVDVLLRILGYSMGIFGRAVLYYTIYLTLLIPLIANRLFPRNRPIVQIGTFAVLALMFYVITRNSVIVPYISVFAAK